ncbi:hypothetical protein CU100_12425 [Phyllobacterium endophyticum]|uniref:Uncharacterized protein n=1 Tax=Phyllobacterium endophyticum TaxID=1149773 RepID=A0A2P7AW05_9HYPH|nr:hypothetical protein CU100_12425 [Phyllobacterium endophyticum]
MRGPLEDATPGSHLLKVRAVEVAGFPQGACRSARDELGPQNPDERSYFQRSGKIKNKNNGLADKTTFQSRKSEISPKVVAKGPIALRYWINLRFLPDDDILPLLPANV